MRLEKNHEYYGPPFDIDERKGPLYIMKNMNKSKFIEFMGTI